jgi:hypothetical protein
MLKGQAFHSYPQFAKLEEQGWRKVVFDENKVEFKIEEGR